MRITYFALKPLRVGDDIREPGDLVPEAASWLYLTGYLGDGSLAPVLVATLPEEQQVMLLEWEEEQVKASEASSPASESTTEAPSQPASKQQKSKTSEKVAV